MLLLLLEHLNSVVKSPARMFCWMHTALSRSTCAPLASKTPQSPLTHAHMRRIAPNERIMWRSRCVDVVADPDACAVRPVRCRCCSLCELATLSFVVALRLGGSRASTDTRARARAKRAETRARATGHSIYTIRVNTHTHTSLC